MSGYYYQNTQIISKLRPLFIIASMYTRIYVCSNLAKAWIPFKKELSDLYTHQTQSSPKLKTKENVCQFFLHYSTFIPNFINIESEKVGELPSYITKIGLNTERTLLAYEYVPTLTWSIINRLRNNARMFHIFLGATLHNLLRILSLFVFIARHCY